MTYEEAHGWLATVGGTWTRGREKIRGKGAVIVTIKIGEEGPVARYGLFDDALQGADLDLAIERAVAAACDELRRTLEPR